jgi:hypothetical protein
MHLTGYSGLRSLPPAGDAGRWVSLGVAVQRHGVSVGASPTWHFRSGRYPAQYLCERLSLVRLSLRTQDLPWAKA